MKDKVYLAKSNKANPDLVMEVRKILSKYDVDIIEYKGGTYTNKPLLECDYLFIVPDSNNVEYDDGFINTRIGKGLYNQIFDFEKLIDTKFFSENERISIITCDKSLNLKMSAYSNIGVIDSMDYINYGFVESYNLDFVVVDDYLDNIGLEIKNSNVFDVSNVEFLINDKNLHLIIKL